MTLQQILNHYWGFPSFRSNQEEIIKSVVNQNDVLAILPTGGGKSLCYQLSALAMPGVALVISPLVALMQDQVMQLQMKGISACALHSGFSKGELIDLLEDVVAEKYKIVYVSPERLANETFINASERIRWSFLAVDEAHCISEWGHDFRPLYMDIVKFYNQFNFSNIIALTASATLKVQKDIIEVLNLKSPILFKESIVRENLFYEVEKVEHKFSKIAAQLQISNGIVYCPTRRSTEELSTYLNNHQIQSVAYHAGLSNVLKDSILKNWSSSKDLTICATNAFGMGIDKPDVRMVLHLQAPKSIESYYQEAGRAGRDQLNAKAILYYSDIDIIELEKSVQYKFPSKEIIWATYNSIMNELQLSIGEGMETLYFIHPIDIAKKNKINVLSFLGAVNILEQNKYWVWQQEDRSMHRARFMVDRRDLEELNTYAPHLYEFSISLLRMYGDIMNYLSIIDPYEIGRFIHSDYETVVLMLQQMDKMKLLKYYPAMRGSSIYLLEGRIRPNEFVINTKRLMQMKEHYLDQIHSIISYLQEQNLCRNVILGSYFGEDQVKDCGHCDNCRKRNNLSMNDLLQSIKELILLKKEISIYELFEIFNQYTPAQILEKLQTLAEEQMVHIKGTNVIFAL